MKTLPSQKHRNPGNQNLTFPEALEDDRFAVSDGELLAKLVATKVRNVYEDLFLSCFDRPDSFPLSAAIGLHDLFVTVYKFSVEGSGIPSNSDNNRNLLSELRAQRNFWLLLHILHQERKESVLSLEEVEFSSFSRKSVEPVAFDQLSRYFSDDGSGILPASIECLPGVKVCRRLLEWLERAAALDLDASIGSNFDAVLELGSLWDPSYRWGLSHARGSLFDLDAPLRGDLQLSDEDCKADERICRACFCLIRCGRLDRALEVLREAGQHWRAALFQGGRFSTRCSYDGARGSHWLLWRHIIRHSFKYADLNFWERTILCLLSGGPFPEQLSNANAVEDRLWCQLWGLFDSYLEEQMLCILGRDPDRSPYLQNGVLSHEQEVPPSEMKNSIDIPRMRILEIFEDCLSRPDPENDVELLRILPLLIEGKPNDYTDVLRVLSMNLISVPESHSDSLRQSSMNDCKPSLSQLSLTFAVHLHWYMITRRSLSISEESFAMGDSLLTAYLLQLRRSVQDQKLLYNIVAHYIRFLSGRESLIQACIEFASASPASDMGSVIDVFGGTVESDGDSRLAEEIAAGLWSFTWGETRKKLQMQPEEFNDCDMFRVECCLTLLKKHCCGSPVTYATFCKGAVRELYLENLTGYARSIVLMESNSEQPCAALMQDSEWRCWCLCFDVEDRYADWHDYMVDKGAGLRPRRPEGKDLAELKAYESDLSQWLERVDYLACRTIRGCLNFLHQVTCYIHDLEIEPDVSDEARCVRIWCSRVIGYLYEISRNESSSEAIIELVDVFADLATFVEPQVLRSLIRNVRDAWIYAKSWRLEVTTFAVDS
jgi:hypothetical protein